MHMVAGQLSVLDIGSDTVRQTLVDADPPIVAKLYRDGQSKFSECKDLEYATGQYETS